MCFMATTTTIIFAFLEGLSFSILLNLNFLPPCFDAEVTLCTESPVMGVAVAGGLGNDNSL